MTELVNTKATIGQA